MNILDMRTIVFYGVIIYVICTLIIVGLWRQNRMRFDGINLWIVNCVFQFTALLLVVLRGIIPDWISIVLANCLVIAGSFAAYLGLERFVGKRSPQGQNYVLLAIFPLFHSYFTFVDPNLSARNVILSATLFIICFQCMWLLLRADIPMRSLTRRVGMVFGAYCLVCIFRIIWNVINPHMQLDLLHAGTVEALIMLVSGILFVLLTYSLILMVNQRLLMQIQTQEEKLSKVFHSAPYAVTLARLGNGEIFEANDSFEKITGYQREEVVGKTASELQLWAHVEERQSALRILTQCGSIRGKEAQFKCKSGELITGLFSADIIALNNEKCIISCVSDISERKRADEERERLISEREKALSEVKMLSGLLPICTSCKKIRDDRGYWNRIELYIQSHSQAEFSHGICPDCMRKLYPEYVNDDLPK